jgi:membrane protease YdiL (CAAX protease family)
VTSSWQPKIASLLHSRIAAAIEITLVLLLTIGHRVLRIIPVDETLPILALGWLSVWLRRVGWKAIGFSKPSNWGRVLLLGIGTGIALQALSEFVTEPLITKLTHQVADVSEFKSLAGNTRLAIVYLVVVWTWAAFGEECAYRGYVLNRAADLGGRTNVAWGAGLIFVTGLFGFGHSYQGLAGMIDTGIHGLILGILYFVSGRNLWPSIIAHGLGDTIAIALVFFGHL